jgi:hypothetical protein
MTTADEEARVSNQQKFVIGSRGSSLSYDQAFLNTNAPLLERQSNGPLTSTAVTAIHAAPQLGTAAVDLRPSAVEIAAFRYRTAGALGQAGSGGHTGAGGHGGPTNDPGVASYQRRLLDADAMHVEPKSQSGEDFDAQLKARIRELLRNMCYLDQDTRLLQGHIMDIVQREVGAAEGPIPKLPFTADRRLCYLTKTDLTPELATEIETLGDEIARQQQHLQQALDLDEDVYLLDHTDE